MPKLYARKLGADAAHLLYPLVAWEEAELLLKRAWPSKDQPHEWEAMRDDVHAGWLDAAAKIDLSSTR